MSDVIVDRTPLRQARCWVIRASLPRLWRKSAHYLTTPDGRQKWVIDPAVARKFGTPADAMACLADLIKCEPHPDLYQAVEAPQE